MQEKNDVEQSDAKVPERTEPTDALERPGVRISSGHGTSSFERILTLGAFAALDQVPPEEPGAIRGFIPAGFGAQMKPPLSQIIFRTHLVFWP